MLMAGQSEPNAADQTMALDESDRRLEFLDRELLALKNEMEIRKEISNNSILMALTRQESREADHGLRQSTQQNDDAVQNLNEKAGD